MEDKSDHERTTKGVIKLGKDLTKEELDLINFHRQKAFGHDDPYTPSPENKDWNNVFVLVKDDLGELLSFGRLHSIELRLSSGEMREVYCFASVVSTKQKMGYGKLVMDEIKKYVEETGITVIGFCETDLIPFYRKCGYQVLSPEDNQFVYVDEKGDIIPGIVPGEVIYYSG